MTNKPSQLELGCIPVKGDLRVGMVVGFFRSLRKRRWKSTAFIFGRIVSISNSCVIIEDLKAPGSRYNRSVEKLFEVHKDTEIGMWSE